MRLPRDPTATDGVILNGNNNSFISILFALDQASHNYSIQKLPNFFYPT